MDLLVTLDIGLGHDRMIEKEKFNETVTTNFDFSNGLGGKALRYRPKKIIYQVKSNEYIQNLQMIYQNRDNGELLTLIDTEPDISLDAKDRIEIDLSNDDIIMVRMWILDKRITGFEIKTNAKTNNVKRIGYEKGDLVKLKEFESEDKIIIGFGGHANKQYGVTSLYCYYMDKRFFGIVSYEGILNLRAKLKMDPEFKEKILANIDKLTDSEKLIFYTCELPDTAFFPCALYLMAY